MLNSTCLVGRMTKDAELRYTPNNQAVATFSLAVNRNFKSQNGEREADFINCVIWRQQAENLANWAKKGALIGITGRIQTRSYENQQGQRVYVTEVVANDFQLLESRKDREAGHSQGYGQPDFGRQSESMNTNPMDISDDDLPFQPMTWIEEHFAREYPEIKTIQDIWDKDDLGGYQTQRYSRELNRIIITNDLTAISNDLRTIGLTLADFKQQLTLF